jgi:CheY-like chemotaxis protein
MPGEAGIGQPDMLAAVVANVRDQQDLGKARQQVFLDDVDLEFAEPAAEFDMPLVRQILSPEDDNDVFVEGAFDRPERRIVDVLREIESDLRTAGSTAFRDLHRFPRFAPGLHVFLNHLRSDGISIPFPIRSEPPMAQILVAESNRQIREFIAGILTDVGHDVTVCEDGVEATAFLAVGLIDIVVTDLVLHEGSRLSTDCAALGVHTITLTGREFKPGRGEQEPPTPLLDKPFRFADLQCVLDAVALRSGSVNSRDAARRNAA